MVVVGIVVVLALLVGGCFVLSVGAGVKAVNEASERKLKVAAQLEIVGFEWKKEGFGSIMEADFSIRNNGTNDVKDIEIECTHYAESGTKIDSNSRTIYEIIKAGETKEFKAFNMGFIHSQAKRSVATITGATELK